MRVFDASTTLPANGKSAAIALGNFDGLHAGHRAVIADAQQAARQAGAPVGVATFEPAPRRYFQPSAPPFRLMTPRRRELELAAIGVDVCYLLAFDAGMAAMTDREFASGVLKDRLDTRAVSVGFDFRFGHNRVGDAAGLVRLGKEFGFEGRIVPEVSLDGEKASSTAIREMIQRGDMAEAGAALGGYWITDAIVEHGEKRGRTLGFPTANLHLGEIVHPAHGVYSVWARTEEETLWRPGVASFGRTPTTGLRDPLLEVVIFDWSGDLYDRRLHVAFAKFLRPEVKFPDIDALVSQMNQDAAAARAVLSGLPRPRN
ncbi:MAG: riboflavin biosynthesis protein RibF [Alphaproteobacteria bacterium]|nr:riboflavin biosynthesis protein RibF [Alphaproteobacteria bacterium]